MRVTSQSGWACHQQVRNETSGGDSLPAILPLLNECLLVVAILPRFLPPFPIFFLRPHPGLFNFHSNVRLSPLEVSLQAFDLYHRPSRLLAMSKPVYQCIRKSCGSQKPAIVFCPDRKQTRITAVDLSLHAAADNTPKMFLHVSGGLNVHTH